jgi:hypothetical protein
MQNRIKSLEQKLETATIKEKTVHESLEQLTGEYELLKKEKKILENLIKQLQNQLKDNENKLAKENLKTTKLEVKLDDYKDKSMRRLNEISEK